MDDWDIKWGMVSCAIVSATVIALYQFFPALKNSYFVAGMALLGFFAPMIFSISQEYIREKRKEKKRRRGK